MIVCIGQAWRSGRTFVVIEASIMSVHYFSMPKHYFSVFLLDG
jgi:hypothetical protein